MTMMVVALVAAMAQVVAAKIAAMYDEWQWWQWQWLQTWKWL